MHLSVWNQSLWIWLCQQQISQLISRRILSSRSDRITSIPEDLRDTDDHIWAIVLNHDEQPHKRSPDGHISGDGTMTGYALSPIQLLLGHTALEIVQFVLFSYEFIKSSCTLSINTQSHSCSVYS